MPFQPNKDDVKAINTIRTLALESVAPSSRPPQPRPLPLVSRPNRGRSRRIPVARAPVLTVPLSSTSSTVNKVRLAACKLSHEMASLTHLGLRISPRPLSTSVPPS